MTAENLARTVERTDPANPAEAPILARQMAAYQQVLDLCVGRRVAEIGCGCATGTVLLAEVAQSVIAVDYDPACIERNRDENTNAEVTFVVAEVPPLPPAALQVDVVVCFQMIEHVADARPLLQAMYDAVLPGGVVVVSTPNTQESLSRNPYHLHEYEGPELQDLLEDVFERVTMYSVLGDTVFKRYWETNREYVRRVMRWDPLGLNRYLPQGMKRRLFNAASRMLRRRLQDDPASQCEAITTENFSFVPGLQPEALDFYAVWLRTSV